MPRTHCIHNRPMLRFVLLRDMILIGLRDGTVIQFHNQRLTVSPPAPFRRRPRHEECDMFRDVRMSELIEANPTLEQQMRDWQTERHHRGENPFDWEAFRVVVSYVGA